MKEEKKKNRKKEKKESKKGRKERGKGRMKEIQIPKAGSSVGGGVE